MSYASSLISGLLILGVVILGIYSTSKLSLPKSIVFGIIYVVFVPVTVVVVGELLFG